MIHQNIKKYDAENRIVYDFEPLSGILYEYEYSESGRTISITNDRNKSNSKTIINQEENDGVFINRYKEENGDVYIIRTKFDAVGKEIMFEKINKVKKTNFIKETLKHTGEESSVWIINYNGSKTIGFKAVPGKFNQNS